jgi:hypothetical protein
MPRTIATNTRVDLDRLLDGDAEALELPDALEPLLDYYRAIAGEHPDRNEYRAAMAKQPRHCCASPRPAGTDRDGRLPAPARGLAHYPV